MAKRSTPQLFDDITETVIRPAFADEPIRPDEQTRIHINPFSPLALVLRSMRG